MTTTDQILELFNGIHTRKPDPNGFVAEFLDLCAGSAWLRFEVERSCEPRLIRFWMRQDGQPQNVPNIRAYFLRWLMDRVAQVAAVESGAEWNPYGAAYTLVRQLPGGSVRLHIDFQNTTCAQWILTTSVPIDRVLSANGVPAESAAHPEPVP